MQQKGYSWPKSPEPISPTSWTYLTASPSLATTSSASRGNDFIFGRGGHDIIQGGAGADKINGGDGSDHSDYTDSPTGVEVSLVVGAGAKGTAQGDKLKSIENLKGSSHADILVGDDGDNIFIGNDGDDTLKGGGGNDTIWGEEGDDLLQGGAGADNLSGTDTLNQVPDSDTVSYVGSNAAVAVSLLADTANGGHAEGDNLSFIENLTGSSHDDQLHGDDNPNVLEGMNGADILKGFGGHDELNGGNHDDKLLGYNGNDVLVGGNGNDTLNGHAGKDTMEGGLGNDTIYVDNARDVVKEISGQGTDTIKTTIDWTLVNGLSVETLRTANEAGTNAIKLTGNEIANTLIGNAGANTLDGRGEADTMRGVGGNDIYYVDNGDDAIIEVVGKGSDTVRASLSYQLDVGQEVEGLTAVNLLSTSPQTLIGNEFTQTIIGNAGLSVLRGFDGDDLLQGMAGNDKLTGDAGKDKFLFNTTLDAVNNVDTIVDMTSGEDIIRLDDAFFAGIGAAGVLNADAFHTGAAAADAEDRIVYNSATGQLLFDSNGSAAGGVTQFANLSTGLALSNTDFAVV